MKKIICARCWSRTNEVNVRKKNLVNEMKIITDITTMTVHRYLF